MTTLKAYLGDPELKVKMLHGGTAGTKWSLVDGKRRYVRISPRAITRTRHTAGYPLILCEGHPRADRRGFVLEHILIAEKALGHPLPVEAEVHHVDEVRDNNENFNLVICQDRNYHALLHARMRVLQAGGDPNLHKICMGCRKPLLRQEFGSDVSRTDGLRASCRQCTNSAKRLRRTA